MALKPEFERTVEECDPYVKSKFESILATLHSTVSSVIFSFLHLFYVNIFIQGVKALEDFIESLRSDSVTQLPPDATVHELTSNVLMFLEQLLEYTDTIGRVLAQDPTYNLQLDKIRSSDRNKALLGFYISNYLKEINKSLIPNFF